MGNRAYVVFESGKERSPAIYLHWNGGPESIYAFLQALSTYEADQHSPAYSCARFVQLVGNTFGGTLSLGLFSFRKYEELYCEDNGVYVITPTKFRRLVDTSSNPRHPNLRWLSDEEVSVEREHAFLHRYWQPGKGKTSFLDDIRSCNDDHFLTDTNKKMGAGV